jgi:hypothetical protein
MPIMIQRQVVNHTIVSILWPAVEIKVDPAFAFVGMLGFELKEIAFVERYVFADWQASETRRLFIVQFEDVLPNVDFTYQYGITNPINLGRHAYSHSVWVYSNAESVRADPGAESDQTTRFLQDHGYDAMDERAMSRFARIVDDERRHEIIIFYEENFNSLGLSLDAYAQLPPDRQQAFQNALTERSLQSFQVTDLD